jgi:hypothetical protein
MLLIPQQHAAIQEATGYFPASPKDDSDLDPIRGEPAFKQLISG